MTIKSVAKEALQRRGRVWFGPARGLRIRGPESARIFLGLYEIELARYFRRLVVRGTMSFDIGAQYGLDALMFAKLSEGPVLSVEADPDLKRLIQRNVIRNNLDHLVQVSIAWVGDGTEGTATIDELAERYFTPAFVKMDIEGAEAAALRGAAETLKRCDRWLIEVHGRDVEDECVKILTDAGFAIETVNQRRWLKDRRPIEHNRWLVATR